jgi:ketopantoate reductase
MKPKCIQELLVRAPCKQRSLAIQPSIRHLSATLMQEACHVCYNKGVSTKRKVWEDVMGQLSEAELQRIIAVGETNTVE